MTQWEKDARLFGLPNPGCPQEHLQPMSSCGDGSLARPETLQALPPTSAPSSSREGRNHTPISQTEAPPRPSESLAHPPPLTEGVMGVGGGIGHRAQLRTMPLRTDLQNQREKAECTPSGGGRGHECWKLTEMIKGQRGSGRWAAAARGDRGRAGSWLGGYCTTRRGFGVPRPGWAP